MWKLNEAFEKIETNWTKEPKTAIHKGIETFFQLRCTLKKGAVGSNLDEIGIELPIAFKEFFFFSNGADLFKDEEYGQWGLKIFSIDELLSLDSYYKKLRSNDFLNGDLIIGEFYGDSDLLLLRCDSNASDYGQVIVALPFDSRKDWYYVANNFEDFLNKFVIYNGDKFWEGG